MRVKIEGEKLSRTQEFFTGDDVTTGKYYSSTEDELMKSSIKSPRLTSSDIFLVAGELHVFELISGAVLFPSPSCLSSLRDLLELPDALRRGPMPLGGSLPNMDRRELEKLKGRQRPVVIDFPPLKPDLAGSTTLPLLVAGSFFRASSSVPLRLADEP